MIRLRTWLGRHPGTVNYVAFVALALAVVFGVRSEQTRDKVVRVEKANPRKVMRACLRDPKCVAILRQGVVASGGQASSSGLAAPSARSPGHSDPRGKAKGH